MYCPLLLVFTKTFLLFMIIAIFTFAIGMFRMLVMTPRNTLPDLTKVNFEFVKFGGRGSRDRQEP